MSGRANSTCMLCGRDLLFVHGHGQCNNLRCVLWGTNQAPCCEGETGQVLSDAQKGLQGAQDGLFGSGRHRNKAGAQNGR